MRKLKKSKPIGVVSPPWNGATRFQDGYYFNNKGECLFDIDGNPASAKDSNEEPKVIVQETKVVTRDVSGKQTEETVRIEKENIDVVEELTLFLLGENDIHHRKLAKMVKDHYGKIYTKEAQIIDYLVNEAKLVAPEEVRVG